MEEKENRIKTGGRLKEKKDCPPLAGDCSLSCCDICQVVGDLEISGLEISCGSTCLLFYEHVPWRCARKRNSK